MTTQLSVRVRNARLDAIETTIGASAILKIRTGAPPANCAAADSGTVLATIALPADWMTNAAGGVKGLSGTWSDASTDNAGTMGHYRIYDSGGVVCDVQGTVTATGGGGDMEVNNTVVAAGQVFTITAYQWQDNNA